MNVGTEEIDAKCPRIAFSLLSYDLGPLCV
jgi:hypothetical protein